MTYSTTLSGEPELLDFVAIQRSAGAVANQAYIDKYGICKSRDPEWSINGERHEFWLSVFDERWASLIAKPHQA